MAEPEEEPFTCPLCRQKFDGSKAHAPCTLPCGHTCCISHCELLDKCFYEDCAGRIPALDKLRPTYALRDASIWYWSQRESNTDSYPVSSGAESGQFDYPETSSNYFSTGIAEEIQIASDEAYARQLLQDEEGRSRSASSDHHRSPDRPPAPPSNQGTPNMPFQRSPSLQSPKQYNSPPPGPGIGRGRGRGGFMISRPAVPTGPTVIAGQVRPPTIVMARGSFEKECGHKCSLPMQMCCACSDTRPILPSNTYTVEIEGVGWVNNATRNANYCDICKSYNPTDRISSNYNSPDHQQGAPAYNNSSNSSPPPSDMRSARV